MRIYLSRVLFSLLFLTAGIAFAETSTVGVTFVGRWVKFDIAASEDGTPYSKRLVMVPLKSIVGVRVLEQRSATPELTNQESRPTATLIINISSTDVRREPSNSDVLVEHLTASHAREIAEKILNSLVQDEVPDVKKR